MVESQGMAASAAQLSADANFRRDYDLLSFLSVIVHVYDKLDLDLTLLSIVLNETALLLRPPTSEGSYFSVTITQGKDLLDARTWKIDLGGQEKTFPELIAIKSPILIGDSNDARNRKVWTSMAIELQILRNQHLSMHPNIVSLLGVCWQDLGAEKLEVMPAFVLEAALMDLEAFMVPGKACTSRKLLGLGIDVSAGVRALHDVGIIHCDLKPNNVLIFKDDALEYTAKVADFGSALLLTTVEAQGEVLPPAATSFWQAPECKKPLNANGLIKSDIYSLGLIVWNLVTGNLAVSVLRKIHDGDLDLGQYASDDGSRHLMGYLILKTVEEIWGCSSASICESRRLRLTAVKDRLTALLIQTNYDEAEKRTSARDILEELRLTLHEVLIDQMLTSTELPEDDKSIDARGSMDFNPQEQEIWLHPGLDLPTKEDVERIMLFGKMMEFTRRNFDQIESKSSRFIELDDIPAEDAARRVEGNIRRWNEEQAPKPNVQQVVRDGRSVIETDLTFGTLRSMPVRVVTSLQCQLRSVALAPSEEPERRAKAAYQLAVLCLGRHQVGCDTDTIETTLSMLILASKLGHIGSQSLVGHCHNAFHQIPSFDQALESSKWLLRGIKMGSLTAKRRLRSLDEAQYNVALRKLRTRYGGIGMKLPRQYKDLHHLEVEAMLDYALNGHPGINYKKSLFFFFATAGYEAEVTELLSVVDVNCVNDWNETALLMACRAGRTVIARVLLNSGADAAISSDEEVTPLHFLAAFDDHDIREIAHELLQHGASIEARTIHGSRYLHIVDTTFGQTNGTPLTWAVAADSVEATRVLMDLGADPFDGGAKKAPRSDDWGNVIHESPVFYAATKHQYYLLEILLVESSSMLAKVYKSITRSGNQRKLNNNYRLIGTQGSFDTSSPLAYCVSYCAEGLFRRILLHGSEHKIAFIRTFDILVRAGADPHRVDQDGTPALAHAIRNGQPFVINYLMTWDNGRLRPSPQQWLQYLLYAVTTSDRLVFATLMQYSMVSDIHEKDCKKYFATISETTDDLFFVKPFQNTRNANEDYGLYMASALEHGHTKIARWFYKTGRCDFSGHDSEASMLGMFLLRSKAFATFSKAIDLILSLENLPEEIFHNAWNFRGSSFSALHLSLFNLEYVEGAHTTAWAVEKVIAKWNEPHHLNDRIENGFYKGFTPLHVAVWTANVSGVRYLLEEEGDGIDLELLDAHGRSAFDLALLLLRNQKKDMDFREVPAEKQQSADEAHWKSTLIIIGLLKHHKAKHRTIIAVAVRPEKDTLTMLSASENWAFIQSPDAKMLYQMPSEQLAHLPIFIQEAAKMDVCGAIFMLSEDAADFSKDWARRIKVEDPATDEQAGDSHSSN